MHAPTIIWSLTRIFRCLKPDIVNGFLYPVSVWTSLAAWLAGVPVVIANRRDCGFQRTDAPLPRWLEVLSYRATTRFVVNSRAVAKSLREQERIASSQIEVIHNGIDVSESDTVQSQSYRRTLGIDATSPVVGMMANFWRHKNHLMLVAAARQVVTEEPRVVFVLAGADSEYCEAVRVAIARFCLQRTFRVVGELDNTEELLGILDIGVLCSESEGFSNTILEYMAYGLPVIATRVGGNPEAVVDNETGYLVDSHDSTGLARAILALVRNPAKRKEMGWRGRERIKAKFRWHRAVGECDALFQSLIANHLAAPTKDR
jgi:glycosyltransferase involved in cell wall biosynthesis